MLIVVVPGGARLLEFLLELSANHDKTEVRLLAAVAVTNLVRAKAVPSSHEGIVKMLLPALTNLFDGTGLVKVRAPLIMAFLVNNDETLQLALINFNAIGKLIKTLETLDSDEASSKEYSAGRKDSLGYVEQCLESALIALAAISSSRDECRKLVSPNHAARLKLVDH